MKSLLHSDMFFFPRVGSDMFHMGHMVTDT
jgi:hypothetical protein